MLRLLREVRLLVNSAKFARGSRTGAATSHGNDALPKAIRRTAHCIGGVRADDRGRNGHYHQDQANLHRAIDHSRARGCK